MDQLRQELQLLGVLGPRLIRFVLMSVAVLVPGHDLVYLIGYGLADHGQALTESGHGPPWHALVYATVLAAIAVVCVLAQRWTRLRARVRQLGGLEVAQLPARAVALRISRLGLALLATSLAAFVLQENLERVAHHADSLPGLTILVEGEFQSTVLVFALLSLAIAAVGSVAVHRLQALAAAIGDALQPRPRPAKSLPRPVEVDRLRWASVRFAPDRGRAPPPTLL